MTGNLDLLEELEGRTAARQAFAPGALLLRGRALPVAGRLLELIERIAEAAPFRRMVTPGGFRMSVAMTNCGAAGWITDRRGYRYVACDPESGAPWPPMPGIFRKLAQETAEEAGYAGFRPDSCLINRYEPGARLSFHQDRDEQDRDSPIVSVSLGLPATFQFGGMQRSDPPVRLHLRHGDVVVWGGPSRLAYHGVLGLKEGTHPTTGRRRINLTFRKSR